MEREVKFAYYVDDNGEAFDVTRNDIDSCRDRDTLEEWARGMEDHIECVKMQTDAWHMNPREDAQSLNWLYRANQVKSATALGLKRVNKRLRDLGFAKLDENHKMVSALNMQIRELQRKLSNATAELEALKAQKKPKKTVVQSEAR